LFSAYVPSLLPLAISKQQLIFSFTIHHSTFVWHVDRAVLVDTVGISTKL
jgi:hypothetical protein